jgi:ribose/xylose/arabinose/galactoside ABC-type transport system permease subunit
MTASRRLARAFAVEGVAVAVIFVGMVVFFSLASPFFLTGGNIANLLVETVIIALLAAGMTFVLVVGGIDLSVGSVTGLSAATTMWALMAGLPLPVGLLVGVGTGLLAGVVNGAVIALLGVNDFIVTLAMLSVGAGLLQVVTSDVQLTGVRSDAFAWLTQESVLGVPTPVLIAAVVVLVLEFVLVATPFGRSAYAAGIGPRAAELAGVPVRRVRFGVYVLSGACAGGAGVLLASKLNSVQSGLGSGYELTAIAAAVLGGISLAGGRGSVWRAVLGAVFLGTLSQGLQMLGVDPLWFTIVTGLSIVAAVALDRVVGRVALSRLLGADRPADGPAGPSAPLRHTALENDDPRPVQPLARSAREARTS